MPCGTFLKMSRLTAAVAAVALSLSLTACAGEEDLIEGVPAFPVDEPGVTVVDTGEHARVLSYTENAEPWSTTVAVSSGVAQTVGDQVRGGDVAITTLPLDISVGDAPEPGEGEAAASRRIDFTVGSGKHSNLDIGQDVAATEGFRMSWRGDDSGKISTIKLLAPPEAPERGLQHVEPALLALITQNVVFPTEPIGEGGVWKVENRVAGDNTMLRTTTYTVESLIGSTVDLAVDVEERPSEKDMTIDADAAGDLNGQHIEVESSSTTSKGHITVDFSRPLPVSGEVEATTHLVYSGGEQTTRVVQDITRAVRYGA